MFPPRTPFLIRLPAPAMRGESAVSPRFSRHLRRAPWRSGAAAPPDTSRCQATGHESATDSRRLRRNFHKSGPGSNLVPALEERPSPGVTDVARRLESVRLGPGSDLVPPRSGPGPSEVRTRSERGPDQVRARSGPGPELREPARSGKRAVTPAASRDAATGAAAQGRE